MQRNGLFFTTAISVHRNEFIKNSVIQHQQQFFGVISILNGKKSFGGIINFIIPEITSWKNLIVLVNVRIKAHSSMEIDFQIWPYFKKIVFLSGFQYLIQ